MMNEQVIQNVHIVREDGQVEYGNVLVREEKIVEIGANVGEGATILFDGAGKDVTLYPGFIDVHIHGANGYDVMDGTEEALREMGQVLPREGTTSFLATTMTQSHDNIERAVENVGAYLKHDPQEGRAEVLGVHLEGPFISKDKAGAQPHKHIVQPDLGLFDHWQQKSDNSIKLVTLAPELEGAMTFIRHLTHQGVVASLGHTNGTLSDVKEAVRSGAKHVTHLFNQMSGLHHREPGVVGGALLHDELVTEMIADGIHVHLDALKLAYQSKGSARTILITDAMRAKCLPEGVYDLGGQDVHVEGSEARLSDGTLAGSMLTLNEAAHRLRKVTDMSPKEIMHVTSANAAKQVGVYDRKGSIEVGKDADFVIMDEDFTVQMTICRGAIGYQKGD